MFSVLPGNFSKDIGVCGRGGRVGADCTTLKEQGKRKRLHIVDKKKERKKQQSEVATVPLVFNHPMQY